MTKYLIFTVTSPLGYLTYLGTLPEGYNPNKIKVYEEKYDGHLTIISDLLDDHTIGNTLKSAFLARRKGPISKYIGYSPEFVPMKVFGLPKKINNKVVVQTDVKVKRYKATFTKDAR